MNEEEARLKAQVQQWLRRAEQTDRQEDALYGPGKDKEDLPKELSRRQTRLQRLREAKAHWKRRLPRHERHSCANRPNGNEPR